MVRAGKKIANGFFCVLWVIKADLDFMAKDLGLASYRKSTCAFCPAHAIRDGDDPGMSVSEFRFDFATWMKALYNQENWVKSTNPLFDIPGVSVLSVAADLMHCKHMGTDMYIYASILLILCFEILPGAASANMFTVWAKMKRFATRKKINTFSNLLVSMFCDHNKPHDAYPKLKGRAAEVRNLVEPLLHVWEEHCDKRVVQHVQITLLLQRSMDMGNILSSNKDEVVLPVSDRSHFKKVGFQYLVLFNALGNHYTSVGKKLFNVTIKAHYVAHSILQAEYINPRLGWCYAGEDFMRVSKHLMAVCVQGNSPNGASRKFGSLYRIGMHLSMTKHAIQLRID